MPKQPKNKHRKNETHLLFGYISPPPCFLLYVNVYDFFITTTILLFYKIIVKVINGTYNIIIDRLYIEG